jgi:multiple sugar transport system permease protein/sn-glycerol 3-phosphate transport system permease protein
VIRTADAVTTQPPPEAARPRRRNARRGLRRLATAAPFVLPSLAGVLLFLVVPVVIVLVLSLFQWNFLTPPHWVGLANFGTMTRDYHVFHALETTAFYVLWNIPVQTVIALGLALLLNRRMPAMGVFRALYVLPYMATPVAMAVVWGWVFNAQYGLVNHMLSVIGVHGPDWLGNTTTALPVVAMVNTWQYAGYNMLFFLAGMQTIPPALYEAAAIDGASAFRRFTRITLPLLNPTLLFVLVTDVIGSFQVFDTVYVMTQGGPGTSTTVINYQIYSTAFRNFDVGSASAMSLLLFGVILLVTFIQFRIFRNRTTYEASS